MPRSTARRVDHVVHAVPDLDAAAAGYEDLGFVVTPRADHPFGTSNRLVVLDGSYLELVAVTRPDRLAGFGEQVERFLAGGSGIAYLVLGSDYAAADHAALQRTGLVMGDVTSFSREATLADGTVVEASFSMVLTPGFPSLGMFLCQHHTPEAVWDPGYRGHGNGASRLAEVRGVGGLERETLVRLQSLTGATADTGDGTATLDLDGTTLRLEAGTHPRGPGPVLTGFTVLGQRPAAATIDDVEVTVTPDH